MSLTPNELVGKALETLRDGLAPFVSQKFRSKYPGRTREELQRILRRTLNLRGPFEDLDIEDLDIANILKVMRNSWDYVFSDTLGPTERALVIELLDVRNDWAHQGTFSTENAYQALDSAHRLLKAIESPKASEILKLINEEKRWVYTDLVTKESRIHMATCQFARNRCKTRLDDNYWHGPIRKHGAGRLQPQDQGRSLQVQGLPPVSG